MICFLVSCLSLHLLVAAQLSTLTSHLSPLTSHLSPLTLTLTLILTLTLTLGLAPTLSQAGVTNVALLRTVVGQLAAGTDRTFVIPTGYDYTRSTNDNYGVNHRQFHGKYAAIREKLDYSYHVRHQRFQRHGWGGAWLGRGHDGIAAPKARSPRCMYVCMYVSLVW